MPGPDRQTGLTLIELMIAMTLGLFLAAGLATLFIASNRSYRQNELIAGMEDQGRFALSTLQRDLAMAGYWGGMLGSGSIIPNLRDTDVTNDDSTAVAALGADRDCGVDASDPWSFDLRARVGFRNHDAAAAVATQWRCIGHQLAGTDAFSVKRVSGQQTGAMAVGDSEARLRPFGFYLQTNATVGSLVRWGASDVGAPDAAAQPSGAPMRFFRYFPRIYFVRDFSRRIGDGIPTLCRKELCATRYAADADPELASCGQAGAPASASGYFSECIAEGIEDMQIVWGLDGADEDLAVDRYTSTPSDAELVDQVRMAQIFLRVRSVRGDALHNDLKTYRLGDKDPFEPAASADVAGVPAHQQLRSFYRRLYSTTVQLRNPVN